MKDGKISQTAFKQLLQFTQQDHVNQTVARLLADLGLLGSALEDLEEKFREMDTNGDGTLNVNEIASVASSFPGISEKDVMNIVSRLDRNGNSTVDISEFASALVMAQEQLDEQLIMQAFGKMDRNGDSRVTKRELFSVLRQYSKSLEVSEVSAFVGKTDQDGDDKINMQEFKGLFPQVRQKRELLEKRKDDLCFEAKAAPQLLARFRERAKAWMRKVERRPPRGGAPRGVGIGVQRGGGRVPLQEARRAAPGPGARPQAGHV